jgi:hypothetical protein
VIIIPGQAIAAATFPGVIVHEAAHLIFCRVFKLAVFDICFFRFGNPAGYVVHQEPDRFAPAFFVSLGPFIVNTALCVLFCLPAVVPIWQLEIRDPITWFFAWLGVSIGMHAFPSTQDLGNVWRLAPGAARKGNLLAILSFPLVGLLYLANYGRFFWLDYFWGIAVGMLAPLAILRLIA